MQKNPVMIMEFNQQAMLAKEQYVPLYGIFTIMLKREIRTGMMMKYAMDMMRYGL